MASASLQISAYLDGPVLRSLVRLSVPIILANALQAAYQLTDAFWVGRLGGVAVAAVSVSFPVIFLLISLGMGFAIAGSTLIAQFVGAQNRKMVNHVAAQTLLMIVVVSLVLSALGYALAPQILGQLDVPDGVFPGALAYLRISLAGVVFTFGFAMFQAIMRGTGEVKLPLYIVAGTVLLNVALDPLLIFGWDFFPALGVAGAAWATIFSQGIAGAIGMKVFLGGRYGVHLKLADFAPDARFIAQTFRLGLPVSIEQTFRAIGMNVMIFLISGFGTVMLAAFGVGINVLMFVIIPAMGFAMAAATLVGQNLGAGQSARAGQAARSAAAISLAVLGAAGVFTFFFPAEIVAFFVPEDDAVIAAGAEFLRYLSPVFALMGVQFTLAAVLRAAGQMLAAMLISLFSVWIFQFPLAYGLSRFTGLGVEGIWWSYPLAYLVITALTVVWFLKGGWQKKRLTKDERFAGRVAEETIVEEGPRQ